MTLTLQKELTNADLRKFFESAPWYYWHKSKKPHISQSSFYIKKIDAYRKLVYSFVSFMIYDIRPRGTGIAKTAGTLKSGANGFKFSYVSCRKLLSSMLYIINVPADFYLTCQSRLTLYADSDESIGSSHLF
jgi:hypothetical protein